MKNFIPLDNNVNKLVAFTPSLDPTWRRNQRIVTNPNQVEPLELIIDLQKEGWVIRGSYQERNSQGRIASNMVKFEHPDITLEGGGRTEAVSNLLLHSFLNLNSLIQSSLGVERLVCTNGLISMETQHSFNFNPKNEGYNFELELKRYLDTLGSTTQDMVDSFQNLKHKELSQYQMEELGRFGIYSRFGDRNAVYVDEVLNVNRDEDRGPQVWNVFNRIQENLSKPNMIHNKNGQWLTGINNPLVDKKFNGDLFAKAKEMAYA